MSDTPETDEFERAECYGNENSLEFARKPEPRTFDVWRNEKTKRVIAVEDGDRDKDKIFSEWERITVQEVIA